VKSIKILGIGHAGHERKTLLGWVMTIKRIALGIGVRAPLEMAHIMAHRNKTEELKGLGPGPNG
jgi:hypothetical protein